MSMVQGQCFKKHEFGVLPSPVHALSPSMVYSLQPDVHGTDESAEA